MTVNITFEKKDLYSKFQDKSLLESPPPGSPPATEEALAESNVEVFPDLGDASSTRRIRWRTKAPVFASEADKETDSLGVLNDLVEVGTDAFQGFTGSIGFVDGVSILKKLRDSARNIAALLARESDHRVFRVDPFKVKFSAADGVHYAYVVDAEARWVKTDEDDPCDYGTLTCQEVQDTNPVRRSGDAITSGMGITNKFAGPLLVAGPFALRTPELEVELDVVATATVDYEALTPGDESFLTVVRAIELTIVAGTESEVQSFLGTYKDVALLRQGDKISGSIDRGAARIEKALRTAARPAAQTARAEETVGRIAAALTKLPELDIASLSAQAGVELDRQSSKGDNIKRALEKLAGKG